MHVCMYVLALLPGGGGGIANAAGRPGLLDATSGYIDTYLWSRVDGRGLL